MLPGKSAAAPRILSGLLLGALAVQVGVFLLSHSNTFDEPAVIGAGYSYVKTGRVELETRVHPPLLKYLLGVFVSFASPDFRADSAALEQDRPYPFGHDFIFHNAVKPERLLALARLPSLLLSLAAGFCLWHWAVRWFGPWGGVLALAAYCLEPNILAHSGLANMDAGLMAFLFMASHFLVRYFEKAAPWRLLAAGLLAGCAVSTKLPGLFFFVWSAAFGWLSTGRLGKTLRVNARLFILAAIVLLASYQIRFAAKLGGLLGQMLPAIFTSHPTEQHFNFLLGETKVGGWWHYYLVALAVKTTLPFLLLAALGFWKGLARKERALLGVPVLSYILICTVASKQNGLRYILPVFPFLCLAIAGLARLKTKPFIAAVAILLAWNAFETVSIAPNYLAYFNQLAGGPRNGHKVLVDSNLDWGQDLRLIGDLLRRSGRPEIVVAVLGNGDRDHYLGPHQDLLSWAAPADDPSLYRHINSTAPAREWLIVSASFLQGFGLSDPQAFAWLRGRAPLAQPGYSSFVYDISSDALSHFNLGKIYLGNRRPAFARRQFERAAALDPWTPFPLLALGDLYRAAGDEKKAGAAYAASLKRTRSPRFGPLRRVVRARLEGAGKL